MTARPLPITLDAMELRPHKTPLRLAAAAASACLLLTGCEPPGPTSAVGQVHAGTTEPPGGLCPPAGPKVAPVLPDLSGYGIESIVTNPCVPFSGLVSVVLDLTAKEDAVAQGFKPVLEGFVRRVDHLNTAVGCAYETDNLGIRVYRQDRVPSSVGVVAVIRENPAAPFDIAFCFLLQQVVPRQADPGDKPKFHPCWRGERVFRGDDSFTVLWTGSTEAVCGALEKSVG